MGFFVFLPLVLPLTSWPIARLAEHHLHPRNAVRLLSWIGVSMAVCSTLALGLLFVVGTAQIPGNPLPDSWSDPEIRTAVPFHEEVGTAAVIGLVTVLTACSRSLRRHLRIRARAQRALAPMPLDSDLVVLPDAEPYAYAVPGVPGRVVVSTAMMDSLDADEQRALLAHERSHLANRHHRFLLAAQLASCVNPFLRPLQKAISYATERWADEEAAGSVGDRRLTARAVARAALVTRSAGPSPSFAAFAAPGPVPRRVTALLSPALGLSWPPPASPAGLAAMVAAAGTAASAVFALNAAVALLLLVKAATPW
ncbi:M56 family metallopeptidase [Kitasatospora sp. NPDC059673]|uniref:M56 family metallopeptidase n=1 Tax=Kitasatospora sp. NPDC059673 TaxID=3346901 RepID=UPI00369B85CD